LSPWPRFLGAVPPSEARFKTVKVLLKDNPDLCFSKDSLGTPLHWAADNGHKDVAELLRQNGGHE
jgi:ankyrin repeat protein